jgi:FixJ family two-component response regulator
VLKGRRIAIVDDDNWARLGIGELIQSLGYMVSTFDSAKSFLESDCVADTACVITDLQMPGMNGLELQRELKTRGCRTPVIFVTAFPTEAHRASALNSGAVGFFMKPFDDQSLIECLTRAISKGEAN